MQDQCQHHAGITTKIENIEKWQEHHEKATHVRIEKDISDLKNRLPLWATFLISGMGTIRIDPLILDRSS